jgi:sugar phosphate isomerase/epimerase
MTTTATARSLQSSDPVSADIERFLLERGGWVKAAEICARFSVTERQLRQVDDRPGLCTSFAISLSSRGFKHVALATGMEWLHAKHAARREAFARLRRVKEWTTARSNTTNVLRCGLFEKDTGQGLFPGVTG